MENKEEFKHENTTRQEVLDWMKQNEEKTLGYCFYVVKKSIDDDGPYKGSECRKDIKKDITYNEAIEFAEELKPITFCFYPYGFLKDYDEEIKNSTHPLKEI